MAVNWPCPKHRISEATFYNGKARCGGQRVSEIERLRGPEVENERLAKMDEDRPQAREPAPA